MGDRDRSPGKSSSLLKLSTLTDDLKLTLIELLTENKQALASEIK